MNKYWISGQGIHKKVIVTELQYYLGPEAIVRPYTREVPILYNREIVSLCLTWPAGRRRLPDHNAWAMLVRCGFSV